MGTGQRMGQSLTNFLISEREQRKDCSGCWSTCTIMYCLRLVLSTRQDANPTSAIRTINIRLKAKNKSTQSQVCAHKTIV